MHKIFVDADACPVKAEIIAVAKEWNVEVYFIASYAHLSQKQAGQWIYIEPSQDGVDFYIFEHVQAGDIVVTADMGLASLLLPKGVDVISSRGDIIKESEMNGILFARYVSAKKEEKVSIQKDRKH